MNNQIRMIKPLQFFLLTYLLSWLVWIPLDLAHFEIGPLRVPEATSNVVRLLGVLMPAAAGMILTGLVGGKAAFKRLMGRLLLWRVGWQWWLAAGLSHPILLGLTAVAYNQLGGAPPVQPIQLVSVAGLIINVFFLLIATLGEEIGWHGVALPALQARGSALRASITLGLLWATWHIPFWLLLDTFDQFGVAYMALNFLMILPMTIFINWVFNHAESSILLMAVFHLTFNIVNTALLPVTINIGAFSAFILLEWIIAFLVYRHLEPPSPGIRPA